MADNFSAKNSSGVAVPVASEEIAGVQHQQVVLEQGEHGSVTRVSASNPLPTLAADGQISSIGAKADAEATANGSVIAILKRVRTVLSNGLPAALTAGGNLKAAIVESTATVNVADAGGSLTVDNAALGATTDTEATGDGSTIALLKRLRTLLSDDGAYYVAGTAKTIKRAVVNVAASQTDAVVVASVATKTIRVLALLAVTGGTATALTFNTKGAGVGTPISPLLANGVNGGEMGAPNPWGWFETAVGEALTVTTGAGSTTGIIVVYVEV